MALSELEAARIGTIHGLCSDLRAHPVEAGVDPAFEVLDAGRSRGLLERTFAGWFEQVVEAPPEGVRRVLARKQVSDRGRAVRETLFQAVANLVETRDFTTAYRRDACSSDADRECMEELRRARLRSPRAAAAATRSRSRCARLGTKLSNARGLSRSTHRRSSCASWPPTESYKSELRGRGPGAARSSPASERAPRPRGPARSACARSWSSLPTHTGADLAACLSRELLPAVDGYQREKARLGALDFFDLLLFTRRLIAE